MVHGCQKEFNLSTTALIVANCLYLSIVFRILHVGITTHIHLNTNYERQATVRMLTPICNALNCGGVATNLHMLEDK